MKSPQSIGGQATARILKEKSRREYYKSPNFCKHCKNIIMIPDNERTAHTRKKKFCNQSCAGKFNNNIRNALKNRVLVNCPLCDKMFYPYTNLSKRKYCKDCWGKIRKQKSISNKTKSQCSSRLISFHARQLMYSSKTNRECKICQYSKFVEVCHIKPIRNFFKDDLVSIINDIKNLVYLCPNCHWEFDHGFIKLEPTGIEPVASSLRTMRSPN